MTMLSIFKSHPFPEDIFIPYLPYVRDGFLKSCCLPKDSSPQTGLLFYYIPIKTLVSLLAVCGVADGVMAWSTGDLHANPPVGNRNSLGGGNGKNHSLNISQPMKILLGLDATWEHITRG